MSSRLSQTEGQGLGGSFLANMRFHPFISLAIFLVVSAQVKLCLLIPEAGLIWMDLQLEFYLTFGEGKAAYDASGLC